jgi:HK97 gp10 family phage protein
MPMSKPIKGLSELNAQLRNLQGIGEHTDSLMAGAFVLQAGGQRRAPRKTGFLAGNVFRRKIGKTVEIVFAALYAAAREFGTRYSRATPYIRPTIDEDENKIVEAVQKQLQVEITNAAKGG